MADRACVSVSFVIPVRNDAGRLAQCLAAIRSNQHPADLLEVIVVDNGSTDESATVAARDGATVLSVPSLRVGALRNVGVAAAHGAVIAFVDADNMIGPGWIAAAVSALTDDRVAAVGAPYLPPNPGTRVQCLYDHLRRHGRGRQPVDWLGSGNMAIRRTLFDAVEGFDTSLETCEDVDLCRKLRAKGYTILADHQLDNVHYGDPQTLRDVFCGELWRGRDNVRVSLRAPWSWRILASACLPLVSLSAVVVALVGLASTTSAGVAAAALSILALIVLVGVRTARMVQHGVPVHDVPSAFSVAAAYELGRAFAVAAPFRYGRRRGAVA